MTTGRLLFDLAIVLYVLGTGAFLAYLLHDRPATARIARAVTGLGLLVHTVSLAALWLGTRVAPPTDFFAALSFFAWAIVAGSLLFQRRYRVPLLGAFATPLAALLMLAASTVSAPSGREVALRGPWLPAHVALVFLGDALLALAACAGLMYLLQERTLKAKRVSWLTRRLPALEVLDAMNSRSLTLGFLLLTLGLLSGAIWARVAWDTFWHWEPKVVMSLVTWVLYAVLLHGRLTVGWRGRRAAVGAIAGFVAVLATLVGMGLFRGRGLA